MGVAGRWVAVKYLAVIAFRRGLKVALLDYLWALDTINHSTLSTKLHFMGLSPDAAYQRIQCCSRTKGRR